jgi:hypothetical protein
MSALARSRSRRHLQAGGSKCVKNTSPSRISPILDPLVGLHCRNVLGNALRAERGFADRLPRAIASRLRTDGFSPEDFIAAMVANWGTGEFQHVLYPDMPWNEEIRATWARQERLAASPRTVSLMMPMITEWMCGRCFPLSACPPSSSTTPPTSSGHLRGGRPGAGAPSCSVVCERH